MLEAVRLDPPARFEDTYAPQVRVFGCDSAEVVPHADDDTRDLALGKLGKGATDVAPSMSGDGEKGANAARQRRADGGSAVERQKPKHAEQKCRSPGFQTIGESRRFSRNVRRSRGHYRGSITQRA